MFEGQPQVDGVTESAPLPQEGAADSSPESQSLESDHTEGQTPDEPQKGSKEFNFRQMRENLQRLEREQKQWEAERKNLQGAAQLDNLIRNDPKTGLKFLAQAAGLDLRELIAELAPAPKNDLPQVNFDEYDPETGKLLKFLHERASEVGDLKTWQQRFEQQQEQLQQQQQEARIEGNKSTIDSEFDNLLIKDGFLDKNGKGDESVLELIQEAVIAKLSREGDPRLATREQLYKAYKDATTLLAAHKNYTLKNTVTKNIPPSGSRNGQATTARAPMTREQRIAELAGAAQSMFGME